MQPNKDPILLRIIKFCVSFTKWYLIIIGLLSTLLMFSIYQMVTQFTAVLDSSTTKISSASLPSNAKTLSISLKGMLIQKDLKLEDLFIKRFMSKKENVIYLSDLKAVLKHASTNEQITGLMIELNPLQGSIIDFEVIRKLILEFKEAGKTVNFWLTDLDTRSLYLASVADNIWLTPTATSMFMEPTFSLVYLGDLFKKLGVDFEVIRAGKFKNAFESLVSNNPSKETLEAYGSIESTYRVFLEKKISEARNQDQSLVSSWLKRGIYSASEALEAGIIDRIGQKEQMCAELGSDYNDDVLVSYSDYVTYVSTQPNQEQKSYLSKQEGLALIELDGEIMPDGDVSGLNNVIIPGDIKKQFEWAAKDDVIKAVVVKINSPGGSLTASDLIWHDLKRLSNVKPVVVYMKDVAASGGYYIALAANKIIADPLTITGSIGVIGLIPNFAPFKQKYGISFHVITQSERKNLLNSGAKLAQEDKRLLENSVQEGYDIFTDKVAEARKMSKTAVNELAQGRAYTGVQALDLGLIDSLGGEDDAFASAKELGGLDVNKLYPLYKYRKGPTKLSDCVKGVASMLECLRSFDARIIAESYYETQHSNKEIKLHQTVQRWSKVLDQDQIFALWSGYLSMSL